MNKDYRKRIISGCLVSTLLFSSGCSSKVNSNSQVTSDDNLSSEEILDIIDTKYDEIEENVLDDLYEFKGIVIEKFSEVQKDANVKYDEIKDFVSEKYQEYKNSDSIDIDANSFLDNKESSYNVSDLYVINANLLDENMGVYICSLGSCINAENGKNVFFPYSSINSDFVLIHKLVYLSDNQFCSSSFYTNTDLHLETSTSDMDSFIKNSLITPLSSIVTIEEEILTKDMINEYLKLINSENTLKLK